MTRPIGVGILGANPDRGWASRSHIPAVAASAQFTLIAVATTRMESANAARIRFHAQHAFTDPKELAQHPEVDLVVVTVKVPAHVELVTAAIEAGKHVYCEWPLSRTATEAASLADAARNAGVHTVVGLQARFAPAVTRARAMIDDGRLGTVLSATLYSSRSKGNTRDIPAWTAYTYDAQDRAGLVEVLGGHALDLVQYLLGPIHDLTARTAIRTPEHRIAETGEPIDVTSPDHLLASAEVDGGAVVSIHLHDSESVHPRTRIEIAGTESDLALVSGSEANPWAAQLQIGQLDLYEARPNSTEWTPVPLHADANSTFPIEAANVGRLYDCLAGDLRHGSHEAPDFQTARALHALIEQAQLPG